MGNSIKGVHRANSRYCNGLCGMPSLASVAGLLSHLLRRLNGTRATKAVVPGDTKSPGIGSPRVCFPDTVQFG